MNLSTHSGNTQTASLVGTLVAGTYRVERVIGRGGMGTVYAAMHETLRERVALKLLQIESPIADEVDPETLEMNRAHQAELHARFLLEARVSARFRNEHIARVTDVGTLDDETPYMVMEYVRGVSLSALLAEGPMAPADAVEIAIQVCEGLAEAHAQRIVHRDIKPSNLLITERADGTRLVKILDFGIMKVLDDDHEHTRVEQVLGSPRYMAPEQLHDPLSVDTRADVWSLGVILYECLLGKPLFPGQNMPEIVASILSSAPRVRITDRPAAVDEALALAVSGALVHDRDARTPNVAELACELLEAIGAPDAAARMERVERALGHDASTSSASVKKRRALLGDAALEPGPKRSSSRVLAVVLALGVVSAGAAYHFLQVPSARLDPAPPPSASVAPARSALASASAAPTASSAPPAASSPTPPDAGAAPASGHRPRGGRGAAEPPPTAVTPPPVVEPAVVPTKPQGQRPDPYGDRQ